MLDSIVKVFVGENELGYVEVSNNNNTDMSVIYDLCTWDKWLNEKPRGVNIKLDLGKFDKKDIKFLVKGTMFKYDSTILEWVVD